MGIKVLSQHETENKSSKQEFKDSHLRLIKFDFFEEQNRDVYYSGKRMIDLILGSIGFLIYMLIYPVVALIIKISSPGPVLFKQERIGINGETFQCLKFRTMHTAQKHNDDGKPVVTRKDDDRIFKFGHIMRRFNIDEIPQIMNVLKGEMSLVGPRPYHVKESTYWNGVFNDHKNRYSVPPGITGFAQARGYRGGTLDEELMRIRLDNDLIYVEKNSLKLDLIIMYRTAYRMVIRDTNGH